MTEKENEPGLAARLLHGAKDLIWEDDPKDRAARQMTRSPVNAPSSSTAQAPIQASTPVTNPMSDELLAVVLNRPTAYSALTEAIAALADIPMDEATRYRSAFAVLRKTQQRTVEQIAQAVEVHLAVLDDEVSRFKGQSKYAEEGEVVARNAEIAALQSALQQGAQQIDQLRQNTEEKIRVLQEDLNHKQTRAAELARVAEEKKRLIAQTTQQFESATAAVKQRLQSEKTKCLQYLT